MDNPDCLESPLPVPNDNVLLDFPSFYQVGHVKISLQSSKSRPPVAFQESLVFRFRPANKILLRSCSYKGCSMLRRMAGLPKGRGCAASSAKSAKMGSLMVDSPSPSAVSFSLKAAYDGDVTSHRSQRTAHTHAAPHIPSSSSVLPSLFSTDPC